MNNNLYAIKSIAEAYKYYKGLDSYFYSLKQYKLLYLNQKSPGDQFDEILRINKRIGREIIDLLMMDN